MSIVGDLFGINTEQWMDEAICPSTDPEIFHPTGGESARPAKAICHRCPVRPECLQHALEHRETGVWGGLSERERENLLRGRNPYAPRRRPEGHRLSCVCPNCNRAKGAA